MPGAIGGFLKGNIGFTTGVITPDNLFDFNQISKNLFSFDIKKSVAVSAMMLDNTLYEVVDLGSLLPDIEKNSTYPVLSENTEFFKNSYAKIIKAEVPVQLYKCTFSECNLQEFLIDTPIASTLTTLNLAYYYPDGGESKYDLEYLSLDF